MKTTRKGALINHIPYVISQNAGIRIDVSCTEHVVLPSVPTQIPSLP